MLVHIEVQGQEEAAFARRMYGYHSRLLERFDRPVVSLAVLTDERANWRPDHFTSALWGCEVSFSYPVVKLLDYRERRAELEASANPFATIVVAHLAALETRRDTARRGQAKLGLMRGLYDRGLSRETIVGLFRFIDWALRLPAPLEVSFWEAVRAEEEARQMPYITSVEQFGMERGRQEGLQEGLREGLLRGLEVALPARFGPDGERFFGEVRLVGDVAVLEAVTERLKTARTLDEVRAVLARTRDDAGPSA